MPKPGASISRRRRSVSPGRPGSRAWKGASIGAVSGTSCACPSVKAMTPARRARGTSASARSSAENRRVPWLPPSGTSTVRTVALDGSRERSISLGDAWLPEMACWSPDGTAVAVVAYSADRSVSKLLVVSAAGTQAREVALLGAEGPKLDSVDWTAAELAAP